MADFKAMDVAQLASGLADLKVPLDSKLKNALMKVGAAVLGGAWDVSCTGCLQHRTWVHS